MTYVVKDDCIKCKLMDCMEVCPVDCFYEGDNMLVIKPDECIDCGVCEPECPVDAIKSDIGLVIGVNIIGSNSSCDCSDIIFISFFSGFLSSTTFSVDNTLCNSAADLCFLLGLSFLIDDFLFFITR